MPLARDLTGDERGRLRAHVRALLAWQHRLRSWPAVTGAPDATPFVTVYADGVLRGCFGSHEGKPGERLTRAFLRALEDSRYGGVRPDERERLAVVVSYVRSIRPLDLDRAHEELAAGTEGVGVTKEGRPPVVLLPHVGRDLRAGPRELLVHLAKKAGLSDWRGANVVAVRTEDIVVRFGERPSRSTEPEAMGAAAGWLRRLIGDDGAVTFAIDARHRRALTTGTMHHGRAAVVVRALATQGGHPRAVRRARAWLERAVGDALRGKSVEGWPAEPAVVAGTLALVHLAGIDVHEALSAAGRANELQSSPWHAAQVVAALGQEAPASLWRACTDDLAARPWAPWTLLAARARGDARVTQAVARAVAASIRAAAPHEGGCGIVAVPEIAVTALVVEALDGLVDAHARRATARARDFLRTAQFVAGSIPAPLDPGLALGAFPASPVMIDVLRCATPAWRNATSKSRSAFDGVASTSRSTPFTRVSASSEANSFDSDETLIERDTLATGG